MSEVLGTVLLTAITIILISGFGIVVFTSMTGSDTPSPTASFTVEAHPGLSFVNVSFRDGTSFPVDQATFSMTRSGTAFGAPTFPTQLAAGRFGPGDIMRFDLPSGVVAEGDRLLFFAVDADTGDVIGHARASVPSAASIPAFTSNAPTAGNVTFTPASIAADGAARTTIRVPVDSTFGLGLVRSVSADLTNVGGGALSLGDDGQGGDAIAGDGIYSGQFSAATTSLASGVTAANATIPIRVTDIFDHVDASQSGTLSLTRTNDDLMGLIANSTGVTNVLGVGGISRNLPPSHALAKLLITNFTFQSIPKLNSDVIVYRVSDLNDFTKTWVVRIYFDGCGGPTYGGITEVAMTRDDLPGSARWVAGDGCWEVGPHSELNLANLNASVDAVGGAPAWIGTGDGATYSYAAAGIGPLNQGIVPYFGDTQPTGNPHERVDDIGLGTARVVWATATGPSASFTTARSELGIDVDATGATDPSGLPLTYSWDWGDGTAAGSGVTASHTYATAGQYTITLNATNTVGLSGTTSKLVTPNRPPTAVIALSATGIRTVSASAAGSSDPDAQALNYTWLWGDGTKSHGLTASHTYATVALYTVRLYANDTLDGTATTTAPIGLSPAVSFTWRAAGLTVATNASATTDPAGQALTYLWGWGDASTSSGVTSSRTYATNATHAVNLTVTNTFGSTGSAEASILHDGNTWLVCPPQSTAWGSLSNCADLRSSTDAGAAATIAETNNASRRQAYSHLTMDGFSEATNTHTLSARARQVSGTTEALALQVLDPPTGVWLTPPGFTWSSTTASTAGPYAMTLTQWNGGNPIFRFVDANCASTAYTCSGPDSNAATWDVDWVRVVSS